MAVLAAAANAIATALLFATLYQVAVAFAKTRDSRRLSTLLVVMSVFGPVWFGRLGIPPDVGPAILLIQPFLIQRLVSHFREISPILTTFTLAAALSGITLTQAWPDWPLAQQMALGYRALALTHAAVAFASEARKLRGGTYFRLWFASGGTAAFALTAAVRWTLWLADERASASPVQILHSLGIISYYLAFATPRFLANRWQEKESSQYLAAVAERDPEERSRLAAQDLNAAAARTVSSGKALVALAPEGAPGVLRVAAATDASLIDRDIVLRDKLVARVFREGVAGSAPVAEVEPELASALSPVAIGVLAAPVATPARAWGVVLALQTRGSLFPEDDLRLLRQFGRYAATALEHGALIADQHARTRRAAEQRLREVESRMALMLDSIKDHAMCILDSRGTVVSWHVGARVLFGFATDEITDESIADVLALSTEDLSALLDEARLLGHVQREGPCVRKDGSRFTGITTLRPLEGEADGVEGFVAITRDVTGQRELEARVLQSQKIEAIGLLAGGVAHDFNNLLTSISGQAQFLREKVPPGAPGAAEVSAIQEATDRAAGLTRQLLAFSRRQALDTVVMNLRRLVGEMIPMLRSLFGERIALETELPPGVALVRGERSQLEQVVYNLALNARDAMPAGGRFSVAIRVGWVDDSLAAGDGRAGNYVQLVAADTGVGMDEATRGRIFDPFFTTKELGRGLGLATVYGIVRQMGGFIRVESQPGAGSTFRLFFPEAKAESPHAPESVDQIIESVRGAETVLLVEDDPGVRAVAMSALKYSGYHVLVAEHAAQALEILDTHPGDLDLVVTDIVMPGESGLELGRHVSERRPDVPVLYMSGYADTSIVRHGTMPKASHFLQKPFKPGELLRAVRRLLDRRS
jgi:PAS domain S-box-containing protein